MKIYVVILAGKLSPRRQGEMAKIVVRALMCGILVSILNACVAGKFSTKNPYLRYLSSALYNNNILKLTILN